LLYNNKMINKIWFAEKQDGNIIELSEMEALTHFESNNISQRMRLRFLGTGDGTVYNKAVLQVKELMKLKRDEIYPDYAILNPEERKLADFKLQDMHRPEIREILNQGKKDELEQAKLNGVKQPDKKLRYVVKASDSGASRDEIIGSIKV